MKFNPGDSVQVFFHFSIKKTTLGKLTHAEKLKISKIKPQTKLEETEVCNPTKNKTKLQKFQKTPCKTQHFQQTLAKFWIVANLARLQKNG